MLRVSPMSWPKKKGGNRKAKTSLLNDYHPRGFSILRLRLSWLWYSGHTVGLDCLQSFPSSHGKYAH